MGVVEQAVKNGRPIVLILPPNPALMDRGIKQLTRNPRLKAEARKGVRDLVITEFSERKIVQMISATYGSVLS